MAWWWWILWDPKSVKNMSPNKHIKDSLVGGFNPSEKYNRQNGFIFPKFRGESQKHFLILLMSEILHQLRLVVHPIIYKVLYISGGCVWDFFHQQYHNHSWLRNAPPSYLHYFLWSSSTLRIPKDPPMEGWKITTAPPWRRLTWTGCSLELGPIIKLGTAWVNKFAPCRYC